MGMMSSLKRQLTRKLNPGTKDKRRVPADALYLARRCDDVPEFIKQRERKSERALRKLYAKFEGEDRALAEAGLAEWAAGVEW